MRTRILPSVLILLLCTACTVNVSPIASPTGTINPAENSITESRGDLEFTAKLDQLSVAPYQMIDNITSFHVTIDNRSSNQVSFPPKAFLLKDGSGRQYRPILPERVVEIVSKDSVYLIPYPYVGFYYLEDQERLAYSNTFSSSLPFYAEYHPQDIFTQGLTGEPILSNSKVSGDVYFIIDLEQTHYAELQVYEGGQTEGAPLVIFRFAIEK